MRISPSTEGFEDLWMLLTLYHSLKNPQVYADLSGRTTSLISPADIDKMEFWMIELAIGSLQLALLAGEHASGMETVRMIMNVQVGSSSYRELRSIYFHDEP